LVAAMCVHAEDEHEGGGGRRVALSPKVAQECSACHVAYYPNFLPTSSWKKVMANLDKHFGTDASLTPADQTEITHWLLANSQELGEAPPENRITKSFWFTRKHGTRHVRTDIWSRPSIKSPSTLPLQISASLRVKKFTPRSGLTSCPVLRAIPTHLKTKANMQKPIR